MTAHRICCLTFEDELQNRTEGALAAAAGLSTDANPYLWILELGWNEEMMPAVLVTMKRLRAWWQGFDSAVVSRESRR